MLFENLNIVAEEQRFGCKAQGVTKAAAMPPGPDKTEITANDFHGLIVVICIINCEVADPIIDPEDIQDIWDLGRDVTCTAKMACS